jgi:hypothetical protein
MNYECSGRVSIWLGNLQSAETLAPLLEENEYGSSLFCRALGIDWIDHDFCESFFIADGEDSEKFLGYFSYSTSFVEEASARANAVGYARCNAAVLVYDFDYQSSADPVDLPLKFVGSFPYKKGNPPKYYHP